MSPWLIVIAVGLGTYAARVSFIGIIGERRLPVAMERALEYVAPSIFAVIVLPTVLMPEGSIDVVPTTNPRLLAAALALMVAWRLKNLVAVIVVGMGALWILDYMT